MFNPISAVKQLEKLENFLKDNKKYVEEGEAALNVVKGLYKKHRQGTLELEDVEKVVQPFVTEWLNSHARVKQVVGDIDKFLDDLNTE